LMPQKAQKHRKKCKNSDSVPLWQLKYFLH
jgi:hypothetical protein